MHYKLSIKKWSVEDRPREKLLNKGISSLSDTELIAILIGSGTKNQSAIELAKNILFLAGNNLHELGKLNLQDLKRLKGIGNAKAVCLLAAIELGRRRSVTDPVTKIKISSSKDVHRIFQGILGDLPNEQFWILLLNRSNLVIDKHMISSGGTAGTVIDTKIIMKHAIDRLASGIILCHNHPSGNNKPSEADKNITEKIARAVNMVDISLLDHLIIGDKGYYSFADNGIL